MKEKNIPSRKEIIYVLSPCIDLPLAKLFGRHPGECPLAAPLLVFYSYQQLVLEHSHALPQPI